MKRWALLLATLGLNGCAQQVAPPDLCDMPSGFRTWGGAEVEWSGFILGGFHHGFSLACEGRVAAIPLNWSESARADDFEAALIKSVSGLGILRARVRGRLVIRERGPILEVRSFGNIAFEPTTQAEWDKFWEKIEAIPS